MGPAVSTRGLPGARLLRLGVRSSNGTTIRIAAVAEIAPSHSFFEGGGVRAVRLR
jgi:hypothetical protein